MAPGSKKAPSPIAVIGAGALGCAVLRSLIPVEEVMIHIIDGDRVETDNLDRQCLFSAADVGKPKVLAATDKLRERGRNAGFRSTDTFLNSRNARTLLGEQAVVIDCTDDLHAKNLIDTVCHELGIPFVSGGLHSVQGQVVLLHAQGSGSGIMRQDIFPGRAGREQDGCDMRAVPAHVVDAVAERMALLVREVLNGAPIVNGELALFDGNHGSWQTYRSRVPR